MATGSSPQYLMEKRTATCMTNRRARFSTRRARTTNGAAQPAAASATTHIAELLAELRPIGRGPVNILPRALARKVKESTKPWAVPNSTAVAWSRGEQAILHDRCLLAGRQRMSRMNMSARTSGRAPSSCLRPGMLIKPDPGNHLNAATDEVRQGIREPPSHHPSKPGRQHKTPDGRIVSGCPVVQGNRNAAASPRQEGQLLRVPGQPSTPLRDVSRPFGADHGVVFIRTAANTPSLATGDPAVRSIWATHSIRGV